MIALYGCPNTRSLRAARITLESATLSAYLERLYARPALMLAREREAGKPSPA